jgi:nucleoside-diphosphate-sugar epimerase
MRPAPNWPLINNLQNETTSIKKVILTGAAGYIGQFAIASLLKKNYEVHAISSRPVKFPASDANAALTWHQADLLKPDEIKSLIENIQPTHLLHFAWYVEHGKFWDAEENTAWLSASIALANEFFAGGGARMVAAGTCAEYDWNAHSPFSEYSTPLRPRTRYGKAKKDLSELIEILASDLGRSFASGRIFFPFGGNESPNRLIPSVIRALLRGEPAKTTHGEQIRDLMYVEDVAEAFAALLESDVSGAVNIASGNGVKIKQVVETLGEITGKTELLEIGALPASPDEPESIVADVARLQNEVRFEGQTPLREALIKAVNWWKCHL